jgi:hypothetical protein
VSWSWTVLLPSDTHRKPIASITAVLLPFVTCLLTLPCLYISRVSLSVVVANVAILRTALADSNANWWVI